jgi:hypothetical protein
LIKFLECLPCCSLNDCNKLCLKFVDSFYILGAFYVVLALKVWYLQKAALAL